MKGAIKNTRKNDMVLNLCPNKFFFGKNVLVISRKVNYKSTTGA
jgi:hypothetical protein